MLSNTLLSEQLPLSQEKTRGKTYSYVHLNIQVLGHYLQNVLARNHSRDHPDKIALIVITTVKREKTGTTFNKAVSLVKTHDNSRYTCILILRSRSLLENLDNDQLRDDNGPTTSAGNGYIAH
jgi:hypothetical protein